MLTLQRLPHVQLANPRHVLSSVRRRAICVWMHKSTTRPANQLWQMGHAPWPRIRSEGLTRDERARTKRARARGCMSERARYYFDASAARDDHEGIRAAQEGIVKVATMPS